MRLSSPIASRGRRSAWPPTPGQRRGVVADDWCKTLSEGRANRLVRVFIDECIRAQCYTRVHTPHFLAPLADKRAFGDARPMNSVRDFVIEPVGQPPTPPTTLASWYTQGISDGLGDRGSCSTTRPPRRWSCSGSGTSLRACRLERALRAAVERFARSTTPRFLGREPSNAWRATRG